MAKKKDEFQNYWKKLMGQAQVALIGASNVELKVQLYEVLEEFFDSSNCWTESIGITVIPNTQDYPVKPLTGRILRLNAVYDQIGAPQAAVMPTIGTVHFVYAYSNAQPMWVDVVKTVTDPLCCHPPNIPEWILPVHGLALLHGLVGNMMLHPGQSYSNPQMANFHLQKYQDGCTQAYVSSSKLHTVGVQPWSFPQQFRVAGQRGGISTYNIYPTPGRT